MNPSQLLMATLHHPLAGARCHSAGITKQVAPRTVPGWFAPPPGTLELGVGRQPNGYTCGTETFIGICEFLRLPVVDPDDDDIRSYSKQLNTSAQYGTDPKDIVHAAIKFMKIRARTRVDFSVAELAAITNGTQVYIDALLRGKPITKPLEIAIVTYQAYIDEDHVRSWYYPRGRHHALRTGTAQRLNVRDGKRILWENDWSDGHWSAVVRVVTRDERQILANIARNVDVPDVREGVVILGDPSNGEGLSFVPIPEFERRWHDTDRYDNPKFPKTAVVLHVSVAKLEQMRRQARKQGAPMFSTTRRNAVLYVP
ncbi:MAG: hypothetical protein QM831_26900 [Kofleriaceae bacterium]